jgi:hypothetical protein
MSTRIKPIAAGSSNDPAVNNLIDFAKQGVWDTQMLGLLGRRPELLKRIASLFAYFVAGEGGLIEPELFPPRHPPSLACRLLPMFRGDT